MRLFRGVIRLALCMVVLWGGGTAQAEECSAQIVKSPEPSAPFFASYPENTDSVPYWELVRFRASLPVRWYLTRSGHPDIDLLAFLDAESFAESTIDFAFGTIRGNPANPDANQVITGPVVIEARLPGSGLVCDSWSGKISFSPLPTNFFSFESVPFEREALPSVPFDSIPYDVVAHPNFSFTGLGFSSSVLTASIYAPAQGRYIPVPNGSFLPRLLGLRGEWIRYSLFPKSRPWVGGGAPPPLGNAAFGPFQGVVSDFNLRRAQTDVYICDTSDCSEPRPPEPGCGLQIAANTNLQIPQPIGQEITFTAYEGTGLADDRTQWEVEQQPTGSDRWLYVGSGPTLVEKFPDREDYEGREVRYRARGLGEDCPPAMVSVVFYVSGPGQNDRIMNDSGTDLSPECRAFLGAVRGASAAKIVSRGGVLATVAAQLETMDASPASECAEKEPADSEGDPVHVVTGEMTMREMDASYRVPGDDFMALRAYSSRQNRRIGFFGKGFRFSYQRRLETLPGGFRIERDHLGRAFVFQPDGQGGFLRGNVSAGVLSVLASGDQIVTQSTGTRYTYRPGDGFLVAVTDPNGNAFTLEYDPTAPGRLTRIVDPVGRAVTFTSAATIDLVTSMALPNGDTWQYEYDEGRRLLTKVTDPKGNETVYEYDTEDRLTRRTNALQQTRAWHYDVQGRVERIENEVGQETFLAYDVEAKATTVTDPLGNRTIYRYNRRNLIDEVVSVGDGFVPGDTVHAFEWGESGELLGLRDPVGRELDYGYNSLHQLTSRRESVGGSVVTSQAWEKDPVRGNDSAHTTMNPGGPVSHRTAEYDAAGNLVRRVDELGNERRYSVNSRGQTLTSTDPSGATWTNAYDSVGNRVTQIDPLGNETRWTYDEISRVTSVTDPLNRTSTVEYHLHDLVSQVTDPLGGVQKIEYDRLFNPTQYEDVDGSLTLQEYRTLNGSRLPTRVINAAGGVSLFEYDALGRVVATVDPRGIRRTVAYDRNNRVISEVDGLGHARTIEYTLDGLTKAITNRVGKTTRFEYDDAGRPTKVIGPRNDETEFFFDELQRPTKVLGPEGSELRYEYDASDRVSATIQMDGTEELRTTHEYDQRSLMTRVYDPEGHVKEHEYDELQRIVLVRDARGGVTRFEYDAASQLIRQIDPEGRATAFEYDELGRVVQARDALGGGVDTIYNLDGTIASIAVLRSAASSAITSYEYDLLDRPTRVTDPGGFTVEYEYDAVGNLTLVRDPRGNATEFEYDSENRPLLQRDALGQEAVFTYDHAGRVSTATNAKGQQSTFSYDDAGNLTQRTLPGVEGLEFYGYDLANRRVGAGNPNLSEAYIRNSLGRVTRYTDTRGHALDYTYDKNGQLLETKDQDGRLIRQTYDELHRLVAVTDHRGDTFQSTYNAASEEVRREGPNGLVTTFLRDIIGRTTGIEHRQGGELLSAFSYTLDLAGNRLSETETRSDGAAVQVDYGYNPRDELISAAVVTPGGEAQRGFRTLGYDYDPGGNRLSLSVDGAVIETATYDVLNQLATRNGLPAAHDADGNMLVEPLSPFRRRKYEWSSEGLLTRSSVERVTATTTVVEEVRTYLYNADGMKVGSVSEPDGLNPVRSEEKRFLHAGQVFADLRVEDGPTGSEEKLRFYLGRLAMAEEQLLGQDRGDLGVAFYLHDFIGSTVLALKNPSDGALSGLSVSTAGEVARGRSRRSALSEDGRFVVFSSEASNLVPDDTNGVADVFLRDRLLQTTRRISVSTSGAEADGVSGEPAMSGDGRYIVFSSDATGLVEDDTNGVHDVFLHDVETEMTRRLSVSAAGDEANGGSLSPAISLDGTVVAFSSSAENLVPGDTNALSDIFLHHLGVSPLVRVSLTSAGAQLQGASTGPSLSEDGSRLAFVSDAPELSSGGAGEAQVYWREQSSGAVTLASATPGGARGAGESGGARIAAGGGHVVFHSKAADLVVGDTNGQEDVFRLDLSTGTLARVSVSTGGGEAIGGGSRRPALSADGRYVAFQSDSENLVAGDTNQFTDTFVRDFDAGETLRFSLSSEGVEVSAGTSLDVAISADGDALAFSSSASGLPAGPASARRQLFVVPNRLSLSATEGNGAFYFAYTPYGRQLQGDQETPYTFAGYRKEGVAASGEEVYAAPYRHYLSGSGRWAKRDPAGDVDGPNRLLFVGNNPLKNVDPTGLFINPLAEEAASRLGRWFVTPLSDGEIQAAALIQEYGGALGVAADVVLTARIGLAALNPAAGVLDYAAAVAVNFAGYKFSAAAFGELVGTVAEAALGYAIPLLDNPCPVSILTREEYQGSIRELASVKLTLFSAAVQGAVAGISGLRGAAAARRFALGRSPGSGFGGQGGGGGGGGGGGTVSLYHGASSNRVSKIVGNQHYQQRGFRPGHDGLVFFAEDLANASGFAKTAGRYKPGQQLPDSFSVIEFQVPSSLATRLGLTGRHIIGELRSAPFQIFPGGTSFERALQGGASIDLFNQALRDGRIAYRRIRLPR